MKGVKKEKKYHSPLHPAEAEVLENVTHHVVKTFLGRGKWDVKKVTTLDEARSVQRKMGPRAMIYAVGPIPSRGGQEGVCFVR